MKKWLMNGLIALIFLLGLTIALYPIISSQFNLYRASLLVSDYSDSVQQMSEEDYSPLLEACRAYNRDLIGGVIPDVFSVHQEEASPQYMALLNIKGDGMMGNIEIPKIGEKLPIYHTTFDAVLQNGVGHMEGSSLPVGGKSTHCVLAGHRGLPSAKLFTDLDQMVEGDLFLLNILNETLVYEVDQIRVVEPSETEWLAIEEGEDLVTLVTCTPYGINTQRLLVRGRRIYPDQAAEKLIVSGDGHRISEWKSCLLLSTPVFLVEWILYTLFRKRKKHGRAPSVRP